MHTDLPVPVEPAISRCGIAARSGTIESPATSLPMPSMSGPPVPGRRSGEHVAEGDDRAALVGHLDADERLARDRGQDADGARGEREREVVGELRDPVDLDALGDVDLEQRDGGTGYPVDDPRRDVEGRERVSR